MAILRTFRCNNCNYEVMMAGEPSALFSGYTTPVVCSNCKCIFDRLTEPMMPIDEDGTCGECGSKEFEFWDYKSRNCAKCDNGTLEIDPDEGIILAD